MIRPVDIRQIKITVNYDREINITQMTKTIDLYVHIIDDDIASESATGGQYTVTIRTGASRLSISKTISSNAFELAVAGTWTTIYIECQVLTYILVNIYCKSTSLFLKLLLFINLPLYTLTH